MAGWVDAVHGDAGGGHVAVGVDRGGAERAVGKAGGEQLAGDRGAGSVRAGDRGEQDLGGLGGVERPVRRGASALGLLELAQELASGSAQLGAGDEVARQVHAVGRAAGALAQQADGLESVDADQDHVGAERAAQRAHQPAAVGVERLHADEDAVGLGAVDAPHQARRRPASVPFGAAGQSHVQAGRGAVEDIRDGAAVVLAVVDDEDPAQAEVVGEHGCGGAVGVVGGDHAREAALAAGEVRGGCTARGPRPGSGEVGGGRAGADHGERAAACAVGHGGLEAGAVRVGPSDDADDARVGGVGARVAPAALLVGEAGLRRRVIAGLIADAEAAGAEAVPFERQRDGLRHRQRVGSERALQREV